MDSSSWTEGFAMTTPGVSMRSARSARSGPAADARRDLCWCGQDMDVVRGDHCPRCGTMRAVRGGVVLARLAA